MKHACRLVLLALILLGVSCIDTREEIWIRKNGSGRVKFECSLPAAAAALHGGDEGIRELIEAFYADTPEISKSTCDVRSADGKTHIRMDFSFDSALDATRALTSPATIDRFPSVASHFTGKLDLKLDGRDILLTRTTTPGKAIPGAGLLPGTSLDGHQLNSIIHLPNAAASSNATRTEDHGTTLIWETPLSAAVKSPVVQRFTYTIPIPWAFVIGLAILAAAILWALVSRLRRRQRQARR